MKYRRPIIDRLMESIRKDERGCWLWQRFVAPCGYGRISIRDVNHAVHRLSWEHHFGAVPDGMMVCHKCDVRHCINPEHLFLGTAKDNVADMFAKGRQHDRKGAKHSQAKLTDDQVRDIRAAQESQYTIAARYGITQSQVCMIRARKRWAHVP